MHSAYGRTFFLSFWGSIFAVGPEAATLKHRKWIATWRAWATAKQLEIRRHIDCSRSAVAVKFPSPKKFNAQLAPLPFSGVKQHRKPTCHLSGARFEGRQDTETGVTSQVPPHRAPPRRAVVPQKVATEKFQKGWPFSIRKMTNQL